MINKGKACTLNTIEQFVPGWTRHLKNELLRLNCRKWSIETTIENFYWRQRKNPDKALCTCVCLCFLTHTPTRRQIHTVLYWSTEKFHDVKSCDTPRPRAKPLPLELVVWSVLSSPWWQGAERIKTRRVDGQEERAEKCERFRNRCIFDIWCLLWLNLILLQVFIPFFLKSILSVNILCSGPSERAQRLTLSLLTLNFSFWHMAFSCIF